MQNIIMTILCLIILTSTSFARDIIPPGELTRVQVTLPSYDEAEFRFLSSVKLFFKSSVDDRYSEVSPGETNEFHPGVGCLRIDYLYFLFESCEFELEPETDQVIHLGGFYMTADFERTRRDFGPVPYVQLDSDDGRIERDPKLSFDAKDLLIEKPYLFLVPAGWYKLEYGGVSVMEQLAAPSVMVTAGELTKIDVTPETDLRAKIVLRSSDPRRYEDPEVTDQRIFTYRALVHRTDTWPESRAGHPVKFIEEPRGSISGSPSSASGFVKSWIRMLEDEQEITVLAYPLIKDDDGHNYELMITSLRKPLQLHAGETTVLEFATINVGKIENKYDGFFRLYLESEEERTMIPYSVSYGSPNHDFNFYLPTERSVDLLLGKRYVLIPYLEDETGKKLPQPEVIIDL